MTAFVAKSWHPATGHPGVAWSVGLGLLAGWLAAGSLGIIAVSLQVTLSWLLLGAAVLCARPKFRSGVSAVLVSAVLAGALVLLVVLPAAVSPVRQGLPLTVVVVLCLLAAGLDGVPRRLMTSGSLAVLALALFRFAQQSLPAAWMLSDSLGSRLGQLTGIAVGRSLTIGASFGGLDFLVVMGVFVAGWLTLLRGPRLVPAILAVMSILAIQFLHLVVLAFTPEMLRALPPVAAPVFGNPYVPPPTDWSMIVRQLLPWNLPVLAAGLHGLLAVVLIRTGIYRSTEGADAGKSCGGSGNWQRSLVTIGIPLCLAVCLPLLGILRSAPGLDGKRIVANQEGQLDWNPPQHDRYGRDTAGLYGMLPTFVGSLGGELNTSSELSRSDLDSADVVVLLNPDTSLTLEQQDRVWQYVREGGSLLVVTEGFLPGNGLERRAEELLEPTSISVNRDAAVSETKDWWGSIRALEHPATTTAFPQAMRFCSDFGASLEVRWPARPLLTGIWGWSAPEQGATWTDNQSIQPGAKLGDLVLAAEQQVGAGRVIVLGDNTSLTNEGIVEGYAHVGHVLSSLASPASGPQVLWRQIATTLCLAGLLVLLVRRLDARLLAASCVLLAVSLAVGQRLNVARSPVVPDGTRPAVQAAAGQTNRLAYIDAAHLEPYSVHPWEFDAIDGLVLNLERNGYLPLMLHDSMAARLERAGLFVSIAPSRRFSRGECEALRQFVERGGNLISMVGAEEAAASSTLLESFGLRVPASPVPTTGDWWEPEPFGRTRAGYRAVAVAENDRYEAAARLYSAWPVEAQADGTEVLAQGRNRLPVVESDTELPVIVRRAVGAGQVVLIGDTCFAMNKNLEYIGGESFSGGYENAHFWRWLLTRLQNQPDWIPPRPPPRRQDSQDDDTGEIEEES